MLPKVIFDTSVLNKLIFGEDPESLVRGLECGFDREAVIEDCEVLSFSEFKCRIEVLPEAVIQTSIAQCQCG
jgi:hypothetical protein